MPQIVSSVCGRTMSSVLCVFSVLINVAVRVDSAIHQSGNCELPRTQEAKKWNEMKIIDPGDHRDVTRAFLDLCVSSLRRGHENLGSFADLILDIRRLYASVVLCIVPICVEKPGKRRAQVGLKG